MNYRVLALPCLMYLASVGTSRVLCKPIATPSTNVTTPATGVLVIYYEVSETYAEIFASDNFNFYIVYYSISLSVNVVLTLMIAVRLILHSRSIRRAVGDHDRTNGLYTALITILIESCALYAINFLLFIGFWAAYSPVSNIFFAILVETQVRAASLLRLIGAPQFWDRID